MPANTVTITTMVKGRTSNARTVNFQLIHRQIKRKPMIWAGSRIKLVKLTLMVLLAIMHSADSEIFGALGQCGQP